MVVLDDQHSGNLASTARSSACPARVERRTGRILTAGRDDDGARAALQNGPQLVRQHPAVIHAHGPAATGRALAAGGRARRSRGSRQRRRSPGRMWTSSTRSMPSSAPLTTHSASPGTPSARSCSRANAVSSGRAGGSPYRCTGSCDRSSARCRSGSSAGSGLPRERSRAPTGIGRSRPRGSDRRLLADPRAAPLLGDHDASPSELGKAGGDRDRAEPDLDREASDRGQPLAGRKLAVRHRRLDAPRELRCAARLHPYTVPDQTSNCTITDRKEEPRARPVVRVKPIPRRRPIGSACGAGANAGATIAASSTRSWTRP